jgi:hypothetical protein
MGEAGSKWLDAFDPLLRQLNTARVPNPGETAAIAFHNPKTAALCFDRIWAGVNPAIPEEVSFRGISNAESILIFLTALMFTLNSRAEKPGNADRFLREVARALLKLMPDIHAPEVPTIDQYSKLLAEGIGTEYRIPVVTVYASPTQRDREYQPGDRAAVVAVLENVPVVNESELEWEQVIELRHDKEMLAKFRKFVHWLDKEMVSKSLAFIEDEIAIRLNDFHEVTRVHGLATTIGLLHVTLDSAALFGGTAALAKLVVDAGTPGALVAGAFAAIAGCSLHIAQALLNVHSQRSNAAGELAYVIELAELSGAG